jgi:hypothetical protein
MSKRERSFGLSPEQKEREKVKAEIERLWDLIDTDYDTLRRECKVYHPRKLETLDRLVRQLSRINALYLKEEE